MKRTKIFIISIIVSVVLFNNLFSQDFLKTSGKIIIKSNGEEIYLKGIGLGGWLVQEGYMLQTSGFANAEHEIRNKIVELIGETKTQEFYDRYWENYVAKEDIQKIREWGFNSIRLPMHYNKLTPLGEIGVYLESGFAQIDSLLSWCKEYQLYLILDLHAAPGGQSDEPISDYNSLLPSLWESEQNKLQTIDLWKEIAKRYVNEEWIGGYDLINEPKWQLGDANEQLRNLYIRITDAVRAVDTNHIIFIEGNWFATDFNGLTPPWDENLVYSFHKYWNSTDQGSIQYLLDLRNNTNRPLWLGETGENSNVWFLNNIQLMKDNNIGWAWWPHKKIESIAGPLSSYKLPQYQQLLDYWNNGGNKPSELFAYTTLLAQVDNLKIENCKFQPDVIDAMFRQSDDKTIMSYAENNIPGRIFATDYDFGSQGYSYFDSDYENTGGGTWNQGWSLRNDGVDIEKCSDLPTNGYNVGWIESGEWLKYTVNVTQVGIYDLTVRYTANNSDGKVLFVLDGSNITSFIDLKTTSGWQNWESLTIPDITLTQGEHEFTTKFFFGGFNMNYFEFTQTAVGVENEKIVESFKLGQNYPNPFNPSTTIEYTLPERSFVRLNIFDVLGNKVSTLINDDKEKGSHRYILNMDSDNYSFASGVYLYELSAGKYSETKKFIYLR